jgi:hypothetical protein
MSKRSRRPRNDRPKDEGQALPIGASGGAESAGEPELIFSGQTFLQFDEWMDCQLETMVQRWIHVAAPAAATVRRILPQNSRRMSGQA